MIGKLKEYYGIAKKWLSHNYQWIIGVALFYAVTNPNNNILFMYGTAFAAFFIWIVMNKIAFNIFKNHGNSEYIIEGKNDKIDSYDRKYALIMYVATMISTSLLLGQIFNGILFETLR